jgi:hypothetical protein
VDVVVPDGPDLSQADNGSGGTVDRVEPPPVEHVPIKRKGSRKR